MKRFILSLMALVATLLSFASDAWAEKVTVRREVGPREFEYVEVEATETCKKWAVDWRKPDGSVWGMDTEDDPARVERRIAEAQELFPDSPNWQNPSPIYCLSASGAKKKFMGPVGLNDGVAEQKFANVKKDVLERMAKLVVDFRKHYEILKFSPGVVTKEYAKSLGNALQQVYQFQMESLDSPNLQMPVGLNDLGSELGAEALVFSQWKGEDGGKGFSWMKNGVTNGPTIKFDAKGNKETECNFVDGKLSGLAVYWHSNGNKKAELVFKQSEMHGMRRIWFPDGRLKIEGEWIEGKPDGVHKKWGEDGKFLGEVRYQRGVHKSGDWSYEAFPANKKEPIEEIIAAINAANKQDKYNTMSASRDGARISVLIQEDEGSRRSKYTISAAQVTSWKSNAYGNGSGTVRISLGGVIAELSGYPDKPPGNMFGGPGEKAPTSAKIDELKLNFKDGTKAEALVTTLKAWTSR